MFFNSQAGAKYPTIEQAKTDVLDWLSWYNTERLHSTIGYQSPNDFEATMPLENAAKAA